MEGPSLRLAKEQLKPFKGKKILSVSGNSKIGIERLSGQIVKDIFSWGKHLVFQFPEFGFRTHFMLFGTFEATVNGVAVTGDYKKARTPRLALSFENGHVEMYNCSIKYIESRRIIKDYDFSIDIMSPKWNPVEAYKRVRKQKSEELSDVLLDQEIFAGVGNIIKNEVLSIVRLRPTALIETISPQKTKELIEATHAFSLQFYAWRKKFALRKNLLIHRRAACPHCGGKIIREKTGRRDRWAYYCPVCQK